MFLLKFSVSFKCFYSSEENLKQIIVLFLALTLNWKNHVIDRLIFGGGGVFVWFCFFFNFPKTSETQNIVTLFLTKLKLSYYSFLLPVPPLAATTSLIWISPFRNPACGGSSLSQSTQ